MNTPANKAMPEHIYAHSELQSLLADYPDLTANADTPCWDMLGKAKLHNFAANEVLFYPGKDCQHLMLILEGCVRVYRDSDEGREITLYRVEPGQLCVHNLNSLVDGSDLALSAITESPLRALTIPKTAFNQGMDQSRNFRNYVLRTLSERLSQLTNLVTGFAFDRLDLRVAVWLIQQFDRSNGRPIQITHNDIARELGTTREMISRILKEFEHKRCIKLGRGRIHLICKHSLQLASKNKMKTATRNKSEPSLTKLEVQM